MSASGHDWPTGTGWRSAHHMARCVCRVLGLGPHRAQDADRQLVRIMGALCRAGLVRYVRRGKGRRWAPASGKTWDDSAPVVRAAAVAARIDGCLTSALVIEFTVTLPNALGQDPREDPP